MRLIHLEAKCDAISELLNVTIVTNSWGECRAAVTGTRQKYRPPS